MQGVLKKFCIAQLMSSCGNTLAPKLNAHVTERIPSAQMKFHRNWLKITRWQQK